MAGFTTKTFDEMIELVKAVIVSKQPLADVSEGSDYDITARILATVFMGNQSQADFLARQIIGPGSTGEFLLKHLNAHGIENRVATKSTGKFLLGATNNGDVQPAGSQISSADGTPFVTTADAQTRTATWSGRTIAYALSLDRLVISPSAVGMQIGDVLLDVNKARICAIKDIGPAADFSAYPYVYIDIYPPYRFDNAPVDNSPITPFCGAVVPAESVNTGADTGKIAGDISTLSGPVGTIVAECEVLEMAGGADDATEADNQALLAARLSQTKLGGTDQYYRELALSTPGLTLEDAIVFSNVWGLGVHTVYPISKFRDERRVGAAAIAAISDHMNAGALPGDQIDVRNMLYVFYSMHVTVVPAFGFEPDFQIPDAYNGNAITPGMPLDGGNSNAAIGKIGIDLSDLGFVNAGITDLNQFIEVGDRVAFFPYSGLGFRSKLYHLTVIQVQINYVIVDPHPILDQATVRIFAGGPLIEPVNEAMLGFFGDLGPGNTVFVPWLGGDPAPQPEANMTYRRHPDAAQAWPGTFHAAKLLAAVVDIEGVADARLGGPVSENIIPEVGQTVGISRLTISHG